MEEIRSAIKAKRGKYRDEDGRLHTELLVVVVRGRELQVFNTTRKLLANLAEHEFGSSRSSGRTSMVLLLKSPSPLPLPLPLL